MFETIDFKTLSIYRVFVNPKTKRSLKGKESVKYITRCQFYPNIMVGNKECFRCRFIKNHFHADNIINIKHMPSIKGAKNIIIRQGKVHCTCYSSKKNNIKSIW